MTRPPRPTSGRPPWAPARPTAIDLPAGNYKAYVQTNTPGLPRPVATAARASRPPPTITVSANTTQDLVLAQPTDVHPERRRDRRSGGPLGGTFVYVFDATTSAYVGAATMGPGAAYSDRPPGRQLQGLRPDQHAGPSPTSGTAARASPPPPTITVSANTSQDLVLDSPPTFTLSGDVTTSGGTAQRDVRVRL